MQKTVFNENHRAAGGKMVDFAGWEMPIQYTDGIVKEHLTTRRYSGLFDVSHMGRFIISGFDALNFIQYALTNDGSTLAVGLSQYTIIPTATGGAIDDAYLYRFEEDCFLLVVNASNIQKDWDHLHTLTEKFDDIKIENVSESIAMLAFQGADAEGILTKLIETGQMPKPPRNSLSEVTIKGLQVKIGRTGYTGEPVCFELFMPAANAEIIWDSLLECGATPIGLGARDTLRLEACLPLYGHEMGMDIDGNEIPLFACPLAKFAVSFNDAKGEFIGKKALKKQFDALTAFGEGNFSAIADLPQSIRPFCLTDKGIARDGNRVFDQDKCIGYITSGTMAPYWLVTGTPGDVTFSDETGMRAIGLALIDSKYKKGDKITIEVRNRKIPAAIVGIHAKVRKAPHVVPAVYNAK